MSSGECYQLLIWLRKKEARSGGTGTSNEIPGNYNTQANETLWKYDEKEDAWHGSGRIASDAGKETGPNNNPDEINNLFPFVGDVDFIRISNGEIKSNHKDRQTPSPDVKTIDIQFNPNANKSELYNSK